MRSMTQMAAAEVSFQMRYRTDGTKPMKCRIGDGPCRRRWCIGNRVTSKVLAAALGCQPLYDRVDMQPSDVDRREAGRRLAEHHGKVGAGQQDCLNPVALLKLHCDAA